MNYDEVFLIEEGLYVYDMHDIVEKQFSAS
jgi:hypothetical protein